jgi:two-component system, LytTR family, sensor kinase
MFRYSRTTIVVQLIAVWTAVALYFAVQARFNPAYEPRMPWSNALLVNFTYYYLWGLCTPVVVWVARRFPFEKGRWGSSLAAHAIVSSVLTTLQLLGAEALLSTVGVRSMSEMSERLAFAFAVNFQSSLPTYWLMLFVWYAIDYYTKFRDRELRATQLEAQLSQAQLQALRMQLNPHFLFNTLNSVSSLMYSDVEAADAMLARLSEFLRLTVDREIKQEIPLEQELEFVSRYLEIEQVRFEDRLRVRIDVHADVRDAVVPSLALQPLVENAIHHGIAPRREGGSIEISARRENGALHLSVADDGVGANQQRRERVGLANTRSRLEQLYGANHQLTFTDVVPRGFRVDITIPYRTEARS